jgi:hypothetical protein
MPKEARELTSFMALVLDTEKRQFLTSKVNSLFSLKRDFMRTSGIKKEKLPIKNDEESSSVAEGGLFHDPFGGA